MQRGSNRKTRTSSSWVLWSFSPMFRSDLDKCNKLKLRGKFCGDNVTGMAIASCLWELSVPPPSSHAHGPSHPPFPLSTFINTPHHRSPCTAAAATISDPASVAPIWVKLASPRYHLSVSILSEDELLFVRVVFEGAAVMTKGLCADFWWWIGCRASVLLGSSEFELVPSCEVK